MRDDFPEKVKRALAERVAHKCSNPNCLKITIGPNSIATKSTKVGIAAHITAAAKGGPRFDEKLTPKERKDISNGIWLCGNCAKLIDTDVEKYPKRLLISWKEDAELKASLVLSSNKIFDSKKWFTYNEIEYQSKLELRWAIFFEIMGWKLTYKPFETEYWNPSFKISTHQPNSSFLVDVGMKGEFTREKRINIGFATNFSKGILMVFEDPFLKNSENEYGVNNIIGISSLPGKIKNHENKIDFEFCTAVVSDMYGKTDVVNLCEEHIDSDFPFRIPDLYSKYWVKATNMSNRVE